MKITSDERRKIAAKLRALADGKFPMDECSVDDLYTALGMPFSRAGIEYAIIGYLADLIDPTCRIVSGDADNHMPHCNLCGTGNFDLLPKYCKGCGARIVYNENVN